MWKTDIKEWENVSESFYDICLTQSEKYLQDSLADSEMLTARAYNLLSLYLPSVIALFIFLSQKKLFFPCIIVSLFGIATVTLLYLVVRKRYIWPPGFKPSIICTSMFAEPEGLDGKEVIKSAKLYIIEQNEFKINCNEKLNITRQKYVIRAIWLMMLLALTVLTSSIILFPLLSA